MQFPGQPYCLYRAAINIPRSCLYRALIREVEGEMDFSGLNEVHRGCQREPWVGLMGNDTLTYFLQNRAYLLSLSNLPEKCQFFLQCGKHIVR